MESRWLRILLIGVFSLWFGVIVPGHERGAIRVAGSVAAPNHPSMAVAAGDSCHTTAPVAKPTCGHCPATSATSASSSDDSAPQSSDSKSKLPVDRSQHCAICKFIGVLDAPVMVSYDLPQFYQLATLEPLPVECLTGVQHFFISSCRGPPAIS